MNPGSYEELFELVEASDLDAADQDVVLAAAEGAESLAARLAGKPTPPALQPTAEVAPGDRRPTYLEEISVEGFRGVGPRARLQIAPGPGLTLVVGRNGSGKSSFAEALEVLLTGTTWRWDEHTRVWREGWRNLHHDGTARVSARFRLDGSAEPLELARSWPPGSELGSVTRTEVAGSAASWEELDWERALEQFRPILSYTELGTMLSSRAAALYDALSAILGLEEFDAVQATLRTERLARERTGKDERASRARLAEMLAASDDPRAAEVRALIAARRPSPDAVAAILSAPGGGAPDRDVRALAALSLPQADAITAALGEIARARAAVRELRRTGAGEIDALAELLEAGLAYHAHHLAEDPADCPLCGAPGAIDAGWSVRTDAAAQALRARSRELRAAESELAAAGGAVARLFDASTPTALARAAEIADLDGAAAADAWERWTETLAAGAEIDLDAAGERGLALRDALAVARAAAAEIGESRASAWRPLLEAIAAWIELARRAGRDRTFVERLKRAEAWMTGALVELRRTRLAPIVDGARANWDLLRHESNVALGDVELRKQGNTRYAAFDVTIDGSEASALGVMSQGEISALAISVFLPRALLQSSPFGFVVIDDPVQSMDPAKVDGLARVLAGAAEKRQVVVFTHDERLPEAIRRLDIAARIMRVQRRARSQLEIVAALRPSDRYLAEALALSKSEQLPAEVITRVIPGFCRSAIEAACAERIRRERVAHGVSHAEVDAQLDGLTSLNTWLAAALGLNKSQGREIAAAVERLGGPGAVTAVQLARRGAHEPIENLDPVGLARDTGTLVRALEHP